MPQRLIPFSIIILLLSFALPDTAIHGAATVTLSGSLYLVDSSASSITVKDALGKTTTLNLTRKTKIRRNDKGSRLNGLVLGDQVTVVFDSTNTVFQISAAGPKTKTVHGGVASVVVGTGSAKIGRKNVFAGGQTRILRNGKIVSLGSLTVHDTVTAHVTTAPAVKSSSAAVQALDIQASGPEESEIRGTIVALTPPNPGDPTATPPVPPSPAIITIHPADGSADVTLIIVDTTLIELDDQLGTFADLQVGMVVEAEFDPTTFTAFRIELEDEENEGEIEGTITAVDAVSCTIAPVPPALPLPCTVTITDAHGTVVTLIVDASTKIERDDSGVTLSDLQVGDPVEAKFDTTTLVAKTIEVEGDDVEGGGEGD